MKILVVNAVIVEPVSTPKFLANRDINREFRQIRSLCEILKASKPDFKGFQPNSLRQTNREFLRRNREFVDENREFEPQIVQSDFRTTFSERIGMGER